MFLGAMNYEPNSDAVLYFYKEIFPHIKKDLKNAKFIIAGKDPFQEVLSLHNNKDVFVTGYVANVKEVFQECSLFIVPLRIAGGTRIKILEAMAMEKAIVSTTIGCEGIEVKPGKNIIIADKPIEFAKRCIELLLNAEKRILIGKNARQLVKEQYDWELIKPQLLSLVS